VGGGVDVHVGDLQQPAPDLGIGRHLVEAPPNLFERSRQGHASGAAQVAVETLDLALGTGAKGPAQLDDEAAMPGVVEKAGVIAVSARTAGVALLHDGLHVVVKQALGYPPSVARARSWQAISVSTYSTWLARLGPRVAQKA